MTRRHYEALADMFKGQLAALAQNTLLDSHDRQLVRLWLISTVEQTALVCEADNSRFDRKRFMAACGLAEGGDNANA